MSDTKIVIDKEQILSLIRKIEINIETTEECIDNFNVPDYAKDLLLQDIEFHKEIISSLKNHPEIQIDQSIEKPIDLFFS